MHCGCLASLLDAVQLHNKAYMRPRMLCGQHRRTVRRRLDWKLRTAVSVAGPKLPSTVPGLKPLAASRFCRLVTPVPARTQGGCHHINALPEKCIGDRAIHCKCITTLIHTCLAALDEVGAAVAANVDLCAAGSISDLKQSSPTSARYTLISCLH